MKECRFIKYRQKRHFNHGNTKQAWQIPFLHSNHREQDTSQQTKKAENICHRSPYTDTNQPLWPSAYHVPQKGTVQALPEAFLPLYYSGFSFVSHSSTFQSARLNNQASIIGVTSMIGYTYLTKAVGPRSMVMRYQKGNIHTTSFLYFFT